MIPPMYLHGIGTSFCYENKWGDKMNSIMIPATCCYVGDILADDVTSDKGITLVSKNTVVNQYIKDMFLKLKVPCVWLYQPVELITSLENEINLKVKK